MDDDTWVVDLTTSTTDTFVFVAALLMPDSGAGDPGIRCPSTAEILGPAAYPAVRRSPRRRPGRARRRSCRFVRVAITARFSDMLGLTTLAECAGTGTKSNVRSYENLLLLFTI